MAKPPTQQAKAAASDKVRDWWRTTRRYVVRADELRWDGRSLVGFVRGGQARRKTCGEEDAPTAGSAAGPAFQSEGSRKGQKKRNGSK